MFLDIATMADSPLKILFVGHEASRTGAPIGFLSLMQWLKDHGQMVPTVWLRNGGITVNEHRPLGRLIVGGRDLEGVAAGPYQLAYLNTATLGPLAEALNLAGLPVICHVHEMDFELHVTGDANLRQLRANVAHYIACSESVKTDVIRLLGIDAEKITVVPECVDVDRALRQAQEPCPEELQQWRMRAGIQHFVCGMGTVSWRKGVDLFLQTVARLRATGAKGWGGLWIGDLDSGPDADRMRHELRVLGLQDHVLFTGSQSNPHAWLKEADVFTLTSREDPYPLAMVEAAALGKTVVGFDGSGGVAEFVREAGGHLVPYGDAAAMAETCQRACGEASAQGLEAARRLCHPDAVGSQIAAVIRSMAMASPVELQPETIDRMRLASQAAARFRVTLHRDGDDADVIADETWEGPVNGRGEVEILWPDGVDVSSGDWVLTLHALGRSTGVRNPRVDVLRGVGTGERLDQIRIRTAGSAMRLDAPGVDEWLLLDGRGRLSMKLSGTVLKGSESLLLRWDLNADIKETLRELCAAAGDPNTRQPARLPLWARMSRFIFGG